ncbi:heliorhodopsin HeR [Actinotalea sp. K2]|uniref:heliorhodopsin HeR n=1 Tax=Actinotalea sp. K2 TaxID=2939438 RepID=UPI002016DCBE|nr:heliorhodopsin HeR [Actinotalea sp. K2]MCL3863275.1 heliorhodopsin HeR [Actinotalea sp. K2]
MAALVPLDIPPARLGGLRRYNAVAAVAHGLQAVAILLLASAFTLPVTATYIQGPPGSTQYEQVLLLDVRLAWGVALFFAISALAHLWVVSPPGFARYGRDLAQQQNIARWVEYSVSSSVMIVLIAQICSVTDVATLILIFVVNAAMILFGWLQEKYEVPGRGGWLPFVFGCVAGAAPWVVIVLLLVRPGASGDVAVPGFVYGIVVSLFVFFNIFAVNQWLQYRRVGRWADYLVGERTYITLSLVAKSLLAWQVFAGTLAG